MFTEQLDQDREVFDQRGYSKTYNLANRELAEQLSEKLKKEQMRWKNILPERLLRRRLLNCHLNLPEMQALVGDENLTFVLKKLCAPKLLLWRTMVFKKEPGSSDIGWHHDKHFQDGNEKALDIYEISNHFSVFIALNDVNPSNGALQILPKSHKPIAGFERDLRVMSEKSISEHFSRELPSQLQASTKTLCFEQGQFFVFHSAMLHKSNAYVSGNPRMALTMRLMRADINFPVNRYTKLKSHQLVYI
jgi:ectoine hydroxylase-related dioxygenase (phytanoyl-CoA dioxygenase family)